MTNRERFLMLMDYKPVDCVPLHLVKPWTDTIARWRNEGLPPDVDPHEYLGITDCLKVYNSGYVFGLYPEFEKRICERTDEYTIFIDEMGRTVKNFNNHTSMPEWLDQPVKSPDDLKFILKEHLDVEHPDARFPAGFEDKLRSESAAGRLIMVNGGGFYWILRSLAGVDGASYLLYDAPELVEELFERLEMQIIEGLRRTLKVCQPDVLGYGEDVAFKTGPLMSPDMFRTMIIPRYRRILKAAAAGGIKHTWYDSDGDIRMLLPDMLDIGIDCFAPCEVAANMQPNELRRQYGRKIRMIGGIDKRQIAAGKRAIDAELERILPVIKEGGYIPSIDHSVSADISWSDYCYFLEKLQKMLVSQ